MVLSIHQFALPVAAAEAAVDSTDTAVLAELRLAGFVATAETAVGGTRLACFRPFASIIRTPRWAFAVLRACLAVL